MTDNHEIRLPRLNSPGKSRALSLLTAPLLYPAIAIAALGVVSYVCTPKPDDAPPKPQEKPS